MLKDFSFRGNYPNFKITKYIVDHKNDKDLKNLPGYLPMEINYKCLDNSEGLLTLSPQESLYICKNDRTHKHDLLELLISSKIGDKNAEEKADKIIQEFLEQLKKDVTSIQNILAQADTDRSKHLMFPA